MDDFKKTVFWTQQGSCTYIFTTVRTASTRAVQAQNKLNPSMERGVGPEILFLVAELLAGVSFWKREDL